MDTHKIGISLSIIGIAAVLMLVLAPITANQTFGYVYGFHKGYKYGGHGFYKRGVARGPHGGCVWKSYRGPHGWYKRYVCFRR